LDFFLAFFLLAATLEDERWIAERQFSTAQELLSQVFF
jgi:hypothetical protein